MSTQKKSLSESILARAELFRRGLLFEGVPALGEEPPRLPQVDPAIASGVVPGAAMPGAPGAPGPGAPGAAAPGATDELVAGAVSGASPLETMLTP